MHNVEAAFLIDWHDCHFLVICRQYFLKMLEEFNKRVWHDSVYSHLTDCQRSILLVPLLQDDELLLFIFVDNWDLPLLVEKMLDFDEELLLNSHAALLSLILHVQVFNYIESSLYFYFKAYCAGNPMSSKHL